ncbi:MAG: major capsid protein [Sulfuritalea sp.]|nr:major capsid protein [Sulfuritalea sp.]
MNRNFIKQQAIAAGKKIGLTGAALVAFANQAMAAVPAAITTAVGDMQTDGIAIATAVVVAFFAVFTIKFLWRSK